MDLPPGTADAPLTVMQSLPLDGFVVVTSPQCLVGMVVEKAMHMAKMLNVPILGLVENMAYALCPRCGEKIQLFGDGGLEEISQRWHVPKLASLTMDPKISRLADSGRLEDYHDKDGLEPLVEGFLKSLEG